MEVMAAFERDNLILEKMKIKNFLRNRTSDRKSNGDSCTDPESNTERSQVKKRCLTDGTDSPAKRRKTDFNSLLEFWGRGAKQESDDVIFERNLLAIEKDYVETESSGTNLEISLLVDKDVGYGNLDQSA